jgi:putative hydrolase of the HAD superfamily
MPTHIYKAALFDLDNTLADRDAALIAVAHALHAWRPEIRADISIGDFVTQFVIMDDFGKAGHHLLMKRVLNRWAAIGLDQAGMLEWFASVYAPSFPQDPRVIGFLTALNDASIPWGIITNGSYHQRETTRALGLESICPCIIVSEEVGNRKPGPSIFIKALDCLNLEVSTSKERKHSASPQPGCGGNAPGATLTMTLTIRSITSPNSRPYSASR